MQSSLTVESEDELGYGRVKRGSAATDNLPQLHQLGHGNVTPLQIEELVRPAIAVQSDSISCGVQGKLGSVIVCFVGRHDRWIGHVTFRDTPERITHEAPAALELDLGIDVLKLAPAALIAHVMGTTRLDSMRRRLDDPAKLAPDKSLVIADGGNLNQITGGGPRNENRLSVIPLSDSISARCQAKDPNSCHRRESARACRAQFPSAVVWLMTTERRLCRASSSASAAAMATASARSGDVTGWSRSGLRSRN
jgi:hypothetical protein